MSSRLSRAIERSQLTGGRIQVPGTPNVQARPRPVQIGPEQLVSMLAQQGYMASYAIGESGNPQIGVLHVMMGPIRVPLLFDAAGGRKLVDQLVAAVERLILAQQPPPPDPELEQLLADSQARTGGPMPAEDDLTYSVDIYEAIDALEPTRIASVGAPLTPGKRFAEVVADAATEAAPMLQAIREAREVYDAQFLPFAPAEACTDDDGGPDDDPAPRLVLAA
jgi:hypothetical protein